MDLQHAQDIALQYADFAVMQIQRIPGSAILIRYVKSSYQNDPVRSAIELLLFLFTIRYLLAPSYSTKKPNKVVLTEDVSWTSKQNKWITSHVILQEIDDLVEDWTPEPLVAPLSPFEEAESEKRPVIVGYFVLRPQPRDTGS